MLDLGKSFQMDCIADQILFVGFIFRVFYVLSCFRNYGCCFGLLCMKNIKQFEKEYLIMNLDFNSFLYFFLEKKEIFFALLLLPSFLLYFNSQIFYRQIFKNSPPNRLSPESLKIRFINLNWYTLAFQYVFILILY